MICVEHLTKQFGSGAGHVLAVDNVSFHANYGEVYGLLGPNGAGKTTTLRMILGLLIPTSGEVTICGSRITIDPIGIKRHIGLVSASAGLYQWLSPIEILEYFAASYGLSREYAQERIRKLIELMDLGSFLHRRSVTLSTGQKQRVNLARALVHDPSVVLLDEPTRGLDVIGSNVVFEFVRNLQNSGKSIVVCTHQLDEAQRLCDRFGLLHRGRLFQEGTLQNLRDATGQETLVEMFLDVLRKPEESDSVLGFPESSSEEIR